MKHRESSRIVPGAKTAVLFLHGICGSPNHFRQLIPLETLVPPDYSYYNILLPGHGGTALDFARSSMQAWKAYVWQVFERLCQTHEKVILVGHSMGTLFSVHLALEFPEKVASLLLVEVPLRVGIKGFGARNLLRWSREKVDMTDPLQAATLEVISIQPSGRPLQYLRWIPRLLELVRLMHQTARVVLRLRNKAIAYQSPNDELVSDRSAKILMRSGRVQVRHFAKSTHFYFHPEEIAQVQDSFLAILKDCEVK